VGKIPASGGFAVLSCGHDNLVHCRT